MAKKATPLETLRMLIDLSPHTPTSASRAAGLSHSTIVRWLNGDRHPSVDDMEKALNLFGYNLSAAPVDKIKKAG